MKPVPVSLNPTNLYNPLLQIRHPLVHQEPLCIPALVALMQDHPPTHPQVANNSAVASRFLPHELEDLVVIELLEHRCQGFTVAALLDADVDRGLGSLAGVSWVVFHVDKWVEGFDVIETSLLFPLRVLS